MDKPFERASAALQGALLYPNDRILCEQLIIDKKSWHITEEQASEIMSHLICKYAREIDLAMQKNDMDILLSSQE